MINRRNLLKLGALAGAAAFVPLERLTAGPASAATVGPDVPLFAVPLSIPPVLRPTSRSCPVRPPRSGDTTVVSRVRRSRSAQGVQS